MKKIGSLTLCILIIVSSFLYTASAYGNTDLDVESYEDMLDFIETLGIAYTSKSADATVTRAEFTDMVIRSVAQQPAQFKQVFADVNIRTDYSGSIVQAINLGIISGSGNGLFNPEEPITFCASVKMVVAALGYDEYAYYKGGYPTGYYVVASELGLGSGLPPYSDAQITFSVAVKLIFNMLNSDICVTTGITDDYITRARQRGATPLTEFFHLKKVEGIVRTIGFATMIPDYSPEKPEVTIGSLTFDTDITDASIYLGKKVTAYYSDTNNVKLVYPDSINRSVIIDSDLLSSYSDLTLITYDNSTDREKKYKLSPAFSYVKNNRYCNVQDDNFLFTEGTLELIDNNGDSRYDVAIAKKYEYMVVSSVNAYDKIAYGNHNGGQSITFDNENGFYTSLEIINSDGKCEKADINGLSADMVIQYARSDDGRYTEAIAVKRLVSGKIDEIYDDKIMIDGSYYDLNSCFNDKTALKPGSSYNLLLAPDNTVTALASSQKSEMQYGYLVDYYKETDLSENVRLAILTTANTYIYPFVEKKFYYNGKTIDRDSDAISNLDDVLVKNGLPNYQVIRYQLNPQGNIIKLDTSEPPPADRDEKYTLDFHGDNSLTKYLSATKSYWYSSYKLFSPHVILGDSTVIFLAPTAAAISDGQKLKEKDFAVVDTSGFGSYGQKTIDAYDVNSNMQPGAIVLYTASGASKNAVSKESSMAIIDNVTHGLTADGEEVYYIYYWRSGNFGRYHMDVDTYEALKSKGKEPASGDIVRMEIDYEGKISTLYTDGDYCAESGFVTFTGDTPADGQVDSSCYKGIVYSHSPSSITLLIDDDGAAGFNSIHSDPVVDSLAPFYYTSSTQIAVYDTELGKVVPGRYELIADSLSAGEENASRVFISCHSHGIRQLFIYK